MRDKALTHRELHRLETEQISKHRSKTAPEKVNRKNWSNSSLQIKTSRGEKVRIKPPGNRCAGFVSIAILDD